MSKIIVVIGAQWGDEGKGKIVDLLSEHFDIVARYQGGHNAGHSVQVGDKSFVLHLLPSGIVHRGKICVLGNGMVIDPKAFFEEADRLMSQGVEISPERVKISSRAHLILPYHRALDHTSEERLGNEKVGTTLRGIGPAYEDKAGRRGIRTADALVPDVLRSRIERNLEDANRIIEAYGGEKLDANQIFDEMLGLTERLGAFVGDTTHFLNVAATQGKSILLEGAQATLLDVDHGTYPFVTSSSTVAGGAIVGTGLAPNRLTGVKGSLAQEYRHDSLWVGSLGAAAPRVDFRQCSARIAIAPVTLSISNFCAQRSLRPDTYVFDNIVLETSTNQATW